MKGACRPVLGRQANRTEEVHMTEVVASDLILLGGRGEGGGGGDFAGGSRASSSSSNNNFDQRTPEPEPAGQGPITDEEWS